MRLFARKTPEQPLVRVRYDASRDGLRDPARARPVRRCLSEPGRPSPVPAPPCAGAAWGPVLRPRRARPRAAAPRPGRCGGLLPLGGSAAAARAGARPDPLIPWAVRTGRSRCRRSPASPACRRRCAGSARRASRHGVARRTGPRRTSRTRACGRSSGERPERRPRDRGEPGRGRGAGAASAGAERARPARTRSAPGRTRSTSHRERLPGRPDVRRENFSAPELARPAARLRFGGEAAGFFLCRLS